MEEEKTLVEQLRNADCKTGEGCAIDTLTDALGIEVVDSCVSFGCKCNECAKKHLGMLADRIEREYMELPILESEPLKVGDKVDGYNQNGAEVVAVMNSAMVVVRSTVKGGNGYHDEAYPLLLWSVDDLKRPKPEVLDADGVPIKVGDVVWFVNGVERLDVLGIESYAYVHIGRKDNTSTDSFVYPFELTHKQPDTLERIEADAMKAFNDYWGCGYAECRCCPAMVDGKKPYKRYGTDGCGIAQKFDLLRRQRELLERGQE